MNNNELRNEARSNWIAARAIFDTARVGSRAWREAAEELEFWGDKLAACDITDRMAAR